MQRRGTAGNVDIVEEGTREQRWGGGEGKRRGARAGVREPAEASSFAEAFLRHVEAK